MTARSSRTRRAVAGAFVTASLALVGCVGGGGQPADPGAEESVAADGELSGEVEFWTINLRKNFQDYFDGIIADFEEANPDVTINWVDVPGAEMQTKYLAALASGNVPDAVNIDMKNFGQLAMTLAPLEDDFSEEELGIYQPGLLDGFRTSDGLFGIPWYNSGTLVGVYRKSIVDEVGFDPANPPQSWQEVLELAAAVHETTGTYGTNADPSLRVLQTMGIDFVNDDLTEATFATQEAADFVKLFQDAYASGAIAPGATAADTDEPQTIDNGQIGFVADMGPGQITTLANNAPDAYDDIYVTTSPRDTEGRDQLPGQMGFSIPAQSENKAAAAEFIKFVTSAEAQLAFCELVPIFPSTHETLEAPLFTDNPGETPEEQARAIIVENFSNAVDTTVPLPAGVPDQVRQDFIEKMKEVMRSGEDPLPALEEQQDLWQAQLDSAPRSS